MKVYTFSEARQKLAALLKKAKSGTKVLIKRRDGSLFSIELVAKKRSPLDVKGVNLDLSADEIVDLIRETRER
ncbi:MAG: type II toxin-antitoxin system Phd/YefM family antitoxin [Planctomycetota bacterium]